VAQDALRRLDPGPPLAQLLPAEGSILWIQFSV
jgi:hypothetical protein